MKILLSPSKTMNLRKTPKLFDSTVVDQQTTNKIVKHIKKLSKNDLKTKMSLSDKQLDDVYAMYQDFDQANSGQAFLSYTGFVFKKLKPDQYRQDQYEYIEQHVRILDALYGILKPSTLIKPYRLDFQMNLDLPLYDIWDLTDYLTDDRLINLASNEYIKMIDHPNVIDITFYQQKNGQLKNIATYTKQARGMMLDFMIEHKIFELEKLKAFDAEGYTYSEDLSSAQELVFLR